MKEQGIYTTLSKNKETLWISREQVNHNGEGVTDEAYKKIINEDRKLTYIQRAEKYANEEAKKEIIEALRNFKGNRIIEL